MPSSSPLPKARSPQHAILAEQVELLYGNANVGVSVTVVAAAVLASLEWAVIRHSIILGWCGWMYLVSAARLVLARQYHRAVSPDRQARNWAIAFAAGAGLAGAGWGTAGVLLYPPESLASQIFLMFVLGGMMLGSASLLAPRPEAFLAFMLPAGIVPSMRLALQGDDAHMAMALLAGIFTLVTLITTRRIHGTIVSSLCLQFENRDLVEDLRAAKQHVEALNAQLEARVRERTAELERSTEQLRAEIIQREQVEEELLRARKLESLGVMAGGIAHDFNNFLTVVLGNVGLAKMHLEPDDPVQVVLDQTVNSCERAVFLSSQLLTFAKGGAPVRRLVSVGKLVTDAVQLARAGTQTSIVAGLADDLGFAEVDPGQIGQVLHNLLLNARQSMSEGGIIEVQANLTGTAGDPRVSISIRDYGCGIPPEVLPRIFDPYFTTRTGANGLGLATAYSIVAKHGGTISVESKPGSGSVFRVDLPASRETAAPQAPLAITPTCGTERLLVMDDEGPIRKLLETVLKGLGYDVQSARDGAEAIALFENAQLAGSRFDAALLDLTVCGGMGGLETAAKLRELDPALKLIVSSGYSDDPVMADFRKYGFDEAIPKPWTAAEMARTFRNVLAKDPEHQPNSR